MKHFFLDYIFFFFSRATKVLLLKIFNHVHFVYILTVKINLFFTFYLCTREKILKTQFIV